MALFLMPTEIIEQINKLRRTFLWEGNKVEHKFHLIKWEKVTQPKYQGSLGVKNLAVHNKSMMVNWLWRYNLEDEGLWNEVIMAKHGRLNQWWTNITHFLTEWDGGRVLGCSVTHLIGTLTLNWVFVYS